MTYTDNGEVETLADGNGNITVYLYDGHDRLEQINFPDTSFEQFGYDANGNKTSWRKRDGSTFSYQYDALNQLRSTTVPGESNIYYFYDGLGRPTEVNRGSSNITEYGYDSRGFLDYSDTNGTQVTYGNDAAGRMTSMTYPDGQVVSYGYDDANAVTDITVSQSPSSVLVADYLYDDMGRVTNVALGDGGSTTYGYDGIGRLDTHTLTGFNVTSLDYNPASQIVMRSVTDSSKQTAMPSDNPASYTPNNLNQYASVDGTSPSYDPNGNLTAYDGWSYGYDAHNRLGSATGAGTSLSLSYDPTGRLRSTTLGSATTDYVHSGDQLIGEYDATGDPINLYVYAPGSDIPIARFSGSNGLSDMQYLRADERGSIVSVTDQLGEFEGHQYDVYGTPINQSDSLFRYTGQILLRGTDLYHYKARAYHPGLGRFLQTDPIGYDDGMNMYAYVGNDPVNMVDSSGESKKFAWIVAMTKTGTRNLRALSSRGAAVRAREQGKYIKVADGRKSTATSVERAGNKGDKSQILRGGDHAKGHVINKDDVGKGADPIRGESHVQTEGKKGKTFYSAADGALNVAADALEAVGGAVEWVDEKFPNTLGVLDPIGTMTDEMTKPDPKQCFKDCDA